LGRPVGPTHLNSSVRPREYLTTTEIERLMAAARKSSRYGHRLHVLLDVVAPRIIGGAASARRVFPLGFGKQSIVLAGPFRKPGDVFLGVVLAHIDHRPSAAPPALIAWPDRATAKRNARIP